MIKKLERAAVLLVLVASPFWLPVLPPHFVHTVRSGWMDAVQPILVGVHWIPQGIDRFFSGLVGIFSLEEENRILRQRLEALRAREQGHRELAEENARLRRLLKFRAESSWKTIPAEVIGREWGPWSRGFLVDRGARDGIRLGMAVITPSGLVGRVTEVGRSSSRVMALTDPHFRVAAILSQSRVSGLCVGVGRGNCVLTYLPMDLSVQAGEGVVTTGGRSFAPKGLPIGTIRRAWIDSSEMFQTADFELAADLARVEEVLILAWHPSD